MSSQLALSLSPRARRDDPVTSHEAAERVPEFENAHYAKILSCLRAFGCAVTYEEIADRTGLEKHAVARRLPELAKLGRVEPVGIATLSSGRAGRTWRARGAP